jgi:hypothetical protein
MLADGGECLAEQGALRDQEPLFGSVASNSAAVSDFTNRRSHTCMRSSEVATVRIR